MEINGVQNVRNANELSELKLLESRTIFLSEGVNAEVAKRVINHLLALDLESHQPIRFLINSPGGEVNSGFAIYDVMRGIESEIHVLTCGLCASIATIINLGATKKHRYSLPNGRFLIHQPLIGGHVQGQASDLEITAREIIKTRKKINKLLSDECSQPISKVEEETSRDYWMDAQEALEYGLISKIVHSLKEVK